MQMLGSYTEARGWDGELARATLTPGTGVVCRPGVGTHWRSLAARVLGEGDVLSVPGSRWVVIGRLCTDLGSGSGSGEGLLQDQAIFRQDRVMVAGLAGINLAAAKRWFQMTLWPRVRPLSSSEHCMSKAIPRRVLGKQGLTVSAIGLGCMGMSDFYGPSDHATNLSVLNHAIDIGVNFLDTADMYGTGRNEQLLSEVLQDRRGEVVLATKFGMERAPDGKVLGINATPEYIARACDASLKRLGVDHIDLY